MVLLRETRCHGWVFRIGDNAQLYNSCASSSAGSPLGVSIEVNKEVS